MFRFNPITQKLDLTGTSGGGGGAVDTLTGNSGGPIGPDGGGNINVVGSGSVTVAGSGNTLTISDSGPFFSWSVIVANQMATTQQGYFTDGGFRVEVQLPAGSAVGDTFKVSILAAMAGKSFRASANKSFLETVHPHRVSPAICNLSLWAMGSSLSAA